MDSRTGVQQGDPLGPLFFALVLQPVLSRIKREYPALLLNAWYLDDGALIGKLEDLAGVLTILHEAGPTTGLRLNMQKCEVWWPSMDPGISDHFPPDISIIASPGVGLLGSPLGDPAFSEELVGKRVSGIQRSLDLLREVDDAQTQLALLRSCLGFPKFAFALRTCAPSAIPVAIAGFDSAIRKSLVDVLGGHGFSDDTRTQISLPVSLGGLGIPTAASKALPAFLASVSQSKTLQLAILPASIRDQRSEFYPSFATFCLTYPQPTPLSLALLGSNAKPQQWLSAMVDVAKCKALMDKGDPRTQARLRSLSLPHAGGWVISPPIPSLGFRFPSRTFRLLLRYRLGLPLARTAERCPLCTDGAMLDVYGDHAASCNRKLGLKYRHNRIRDTFNALASAAGFTTVLEARHLLAGRPDLFPADILLQDWTGETSVCIDISVVNPLAVTSVRQAARSDGSTARQAEAVKVVKYGALCTANALEFIPVVLETFGGFGPRALPVLRRIGDALSDASDLDAATATARFATRLTMSCQQALGRTLVARYLSPAAHLLVDED
jgi:hypothetical protein